MDGWYENGHLPIDIVGSLVPIFTSRGIPAAEVIALGGFAERGTWHTNAVPIDLENMIEGIRSFLRAGPAGYRLGAMAARALGERIEAIQSEKVFDLPEEGSRE